MPSLCNPFMLHVRQCERMRVLMRSLVPMCACVCVNAWGVVRACARAQGLSVDADWGAMSEDERRRALLNDELVQVGRPRRPARCLRARARALFAFGEFKLKVQARIAEADRRNPHAIACACTSAYAPITAKRRISSRCLLQRRTAHRVCAL